MNASSHKLAAALATRIGVALPYPLTARAEGSSVTLYVDQNVIGGSAAAAIIKDPGSGELGERAQTAVRAMLSGILDCVSEYLTVPWPTEVDGEMAISGARADAHRLHLWYGRSETDPVFSFAPIEIGDLNA